MWRLLLSFLSISVTMTQVAGYCGSSGDKPGFSGSPLVKEVGEGRVLVTWAGLVTNTHCADDFVVKSWPSAQPGDSTVSGSIGTDTFSHEVTEVAPGEEWTFQVGHNGQEYSG